MMKKIAIFALLTFFCAHDAFADSAQPALAETVVYAGMKVGLANYSYANIAENNRIANGFLAGYVIREKFAAELEYHSLASFKAATNKILGDSWSLSTVASFPVKKKIAVFGKVGIASTVLLDTPASSGSAAHQRNSIILGFGTQYIINARFAVRAGVDIFQINSTRGNGSIKLPYLGAIYTP
jgi:hypothetical protein